MGSPWAKLYHGSFTTTASWICPFGANSFEGKTQPGGELAFVKLARSLVIA